MKVSSGDNSNKVGFFNCSEASMKPKNKNENRGIYLLLFLLSINL